MADRSPEQILMDEVKRLTRGQNPAVAQALMPAVPKVSSGRGSAPASSTRAAASSTSARASSAAQTVLSPRQANQGYTLPVPEATQPAQSSGNSTLGTIGSTALKVFTSGLGLVPIISGLSGLFGGSSKAPAPLVPYAMPRSIHIDAANSPGAGGFQVADHGQSGAPRAYGQAPAAANSVSPQAGAPRWPTPTPGGTSGAAAPAAAGGTTSSGAAQPQIVVNVSAMDSQSFLDRSQDIAQAVRQAMLNMHSLNDVVSEL